MDVDPKLALTFVSVEREGSFTAAARALNVAQPWVSEQMRKLEDQLGAKLFHRTPRVLKLTEDGRRLLPLATQLAEANSRMQAFAREAKSRSLNSLRVGSVSLIAEFPERLLLHDAFIERYQSAELLLQRGAATALQNQLLAEQIDVYIGFRSSFDLPGGFRQVLLCQRYAHILLPAESELAELEEIELPMLHGQRFVTCEQLYDPVAWRASFRPLLDAGVEAVFAPEATRSTLEHFARIRRLPCLRWEINPSPRKQLGDMVRVPIAGVPLRLEVALFYHLKARRPLIRGLVALAEQLASRDRNAPFVPENGLTALARA
ncbi:MAG: LysR family transcriptional regulator [Pseudomonadota bacterium]